MKSILIFLALAVLSCGSSGTRASLPETPPPIQAGFSSDSNAATQHSFVMSATTEAHRRSILIAPVGGIVEKVLVREGMYVKKGTRLVELQQEDYLIRVKTAEAAVAAAKAQMDGLQLAHDRLKKLRSTDSVPQSEYDTIHAQYTAAQAQHAQAKAGLQMARKVFRDSVISAPYDGLIIKRMINEGEFAAAMPPTPLVVIEEVHPLDLRINIPATRSGQIQEGTAVVVRFPATQQEVHATITRITPWVDPRNRSFSAIIELPNPDHTLMPGLYAEVRLEGTP